MFYIRNPLVREQLACKPVSIIGCGSFGSALADMLVRAGAGKLTLIDPEPLSIENVGRHVLTARDIGQAKVTALAEHLRRISPELEVEARQEKFRDGDGLLVCCADSRRCESMVNAAALCKGLPAVYVAAYGAVRAGEVQFYLPGQTACRECFARFREIQEIPPGRERYTDPDYDETRTPWQTGLWGSVLAVGGVAFHVILALLGVRGSLDPERPLWIVNLDYEGLRPYSVTFAKVARGCPVCDESKVAELGFDPQA
ncbi:MAG: ThiF family adenylyltransferase [Acidobacteria bacterium]|nr:ThiF family adenylyltransferase [Acidobacteriota bacterium]